MINLDYSKKMLMSMLTFGTTGCTLIAKKIRESNLFPLYFLFLINIFYPQGELISVHLLRYSGIRGEIPPTRPNPLHPLSLEYAPISTRE